MEGYKTELIFTQTIRVSKQVFEINQDKKIRPLMQSNNLKILN